MEVIQLRNYQRTCRRPRLGRRDVRRAEGVQHKPYAESEVKLLPIEPRGVLNIGHEGGEHTAENDIWV